MSRFLELQPRSVLIAAEREGRAGRGSSEFFPAPGSGAARPGRVRGGADRHRAAVAWGAGEDPAADSALAKGVRDGRSGRRRGTRVGVEKLEERLAELPRRLERLRKSGEAKLSPRDAEARFLRERGG